MVFNHAPHVPVQPPDRRKASKNVSMLPLSYLTCFAPLEVGKRSEWDRRMLSKNLKLPAEVQKAPQILVIPKREPSTALVFDSEREKGVRQK